MNRTAAQALRQKFMKVPAPKRRHLHWSVAVPYSRKMNGSVYAYQDEGYALWIELEFDCDVRSFNLEPEPVWVSQGDRSIDIPLRAASLDHAEHLTLHFTQETLDRVGGAVAEDLLNAHQWESLDASIRVWHDLSEMGRIDRFNKDMLLRYVCAPHVVANAGIEMQILEMLRKFRKISVWDVLNNLKNQDEEETKTALANLILGKRIFVDMTARFSVRSEISRQDIFHE